MAQPLVSVIMPAYKVEPYIGQAIESVQAQTITDWELIIVDDASPDNTTQVVQRYLGDRRIKFLQNERNLGAGLTRNRALEVAQGEWIALLDADDWYEPQRLERMLALAEAFKASYVIDLRRIIYTNSKRTRIARVSLAHPNPTEPTWYDIYECVHGHIVEQPLIQHEVIRRWNLRYNELPIGNDYFFQFRVLCKTRSALVLPEAMYNNRLHTESLSARYASRIDLIEREYDALLCLPEVRQDPHLCELVEMDFQRSLALHRANILHQSIKRGQLREVIRLLREDWRVLRVYLRELRAEVKSRLNLKIH